MPHVFAKFPLQDGCSGVAPERTRKMSLDQQRSLDRAPHRTHLRYRVGLHVPAMGQQPIAERSQPEYRLTKAPAATTDPFLIWALLNTTAPMPIKQRFSTVQPWMTTL